MRASDFMTKVLTDTPEVVIIQRLGAGLPSDTAAVTIVEIDGEQFALSIEKLSRPWKQPLIHDRMNATVLANRLGVQLSVVLDTMSVLGIPQVGRGGRYELTDDQVKQIAARIGDAP